jgi:glycosyltransferase involved in cell wall biosynthesis
MIKRRILIFADYYLPGFKAGGPIRSIQSICDALGNEFDIYLVTRDRDIGSIEPYIHLAVNQWLTVNEIKVKYKVCNEMTIASIKSILDEIKPDVIHCNSLMSIRFSFIPIYTALRYKDYNGKILLSPRGELSQGALSLKRFQKIVYLKIYSLLGIDASVKWLASSDSEQKDISRKFSGSKGNVIRVDNLPNIKSWKEDIPRTCQKNENSLKLVFLSRISKMKNLNFLLNLLHDIDINIHLSVYGPKEDISYFDECNDIASKLPSNIHVKFLGSLSPSDVYLTLKEFDLFVLPTLGENFGQAIWEALASSVPVLISDRTPWVDLKSKGVGWDVSLEDPEEFKRVINEVFNMSEVRHGSMRNNCRVYAFDYVTNSNSLKKLKDLYNG